MRSTVAALFALLLAGCAQAMWGKEGVTASEIARDVAECQSELPLAEANYDEAFLSRGYSTALERLRDDPNAYGMYKASLMRLCLLSRGYRHVDMQELSAIQQYVPLPPSVDPAPGP
jgi:hypothetical protein